MNPLLILSFELLILGAPRELSKILTYLRSLVVQYPPVQVSMLNFCVPHPQQVERALFIMFLSCRRRFVSHDLINNPDRRFNPFGEV